MWPRSRPLWALCTLPACQAPQADTSPSPTTPPAATQAASSTRSSTGDKGGSPGPGGSSGSVSTASAVSTTSTGEGEATTLLVGADVDLCDGKPVGCKGQIDLLFVISRHDGFLREDALLMVTLITHNHDGDGRPATS